MILRSVMKHVRDQNWFAVGIDFLIVVVGVFIGIQVANWNDAQADRARELLLLGELRAEVADSIRQTDIRQRAFEQVGRSGLQALAFLDSGASCENNCWDELVDFFHASQWQRLVVELPSYEELRRNGWPRNRSIVEAVEAFRRQGLQAAVPLDEPPAYRSLVRGLIPIAAHRPYWLNCFQLVDGEESYLESCTPGVEPSVSAAAIDAIRGHPDVKPSLTEWAGFASALPSTLEGQNEVARRALASIEAELEARR
jgi:hypothetical protein